MRRDKFGGFKFIYPFMLLGCLFGMYTLTKFYGSNDFYFLYNRIHQLYTCLINGASIHYYYNDLIGVGYGSSFFYGTLGLLPFIPFYMVGIKCLYISYLTIALYVNYKGSMLLFSDYVKEARLCALLYSFSTLMIEFFSSLDIWSNLLNIGISWFLLHFCVKYFRDKIDKYRYLMCLTYFVMLNTHIVSSVIVVPFILYLFIIYFDKSRIKNYIKTGILCLLTCLSTLSIILWQISICDNTWKINRDLFEYAKSGSRGSAFPSLVPIFGYIGNSLFNILSGYSFVNFGIFCCLVYLFITRVRKYISNKEKVALVSCCILGVFSYFVFWDFIIQYVNIPIQFSVRFAPYILVCVLIIIFKHVDEITIKKSKDFKVALIMLILCIPDIFLFSLMTNVVEKDIADGNLMQRVANEGYSTITSEEDLLTVIRMQTANGEYLNSSFERYTEVWNKYAYGVIDQYDILYEFEQSDNGVIKVHIPEHNENLVLHFPRLYYKGFNLVGNDITFDTEMGESQFIKADIGTYSGDLILYWDSPTWLTLLDLLLVIMLIYLLLKIIWGDVLD